MLQTQETESVMKLCRELLIDAIDKHGTNILCEKKNWGLGLKVVLKRTSIETRNIMEIC
jgi:hypothetical protein